MRFDTYQLDLSRPPSELSECIFDDPGEISPRERSQIDARR